MSTPTPITRPLPRLILLACTVWLLLAVPLAWWDAQGRWVAEGGHVGFKLWLFWAQWAAGPACVAVLAALRGERSALRIAARGLLALGLAVLVWAGQIEPRWLRVQHTTIQTEVRGAAPLRIALVADIHWGLFVRDADLARLVDTLAALEVDAIFVAGDWTYDPPLDLSTGFAPLARLTAKVPVFAVLGNHDMEAPGPKLAGALRTALTRHGVQLLEGRKLNWHGWELVGLDDFMGGQPEPQIRQLLTGPAPGNRIVLTHEPDTALHWPAGAVQVALMGHTHGGQIQLPWLTAQVLRGLQDSPWYEGLYATRKGQIFVTAGTGMIGLPLRLAVPPRVDVLDIRPLP